ncbi:AAA domain-containing protein [Paraburkholderia tropica]|uniref:AAA domain-containing protein n=1 Tax=Paraburkholderia tropica TaxID=92647 RepID=A0ABX5MQI5_9BURK|nr:AAA family ATPase [Paraburkholderia tropica]PXX15211.1 AAA domain-containing protein [Paraburkholderia tropica]PZW80892.1 AAA domain-containing protein [Paraburkholderia tropica]
MFSNGWRNRRNCVNGPVLEVASEIPVLPVIWLWRFWLARGKLHILAGPPSTGKTTLALQVAATLTRGGTWPDGSQAPIARVVIWTCEDGIEDTIMPRLISCDVDPSRVYILRVTNENNRTRAFDFTRDLVPLEAKVRELGDVALVIIDSIVQVVTGNSNNNSKRLGQAIRPRVLIECIVVPTKFFSGN